MSNSASSPSDHSGSGLPGGPAEPAEPAETAARPAGAAGPSAAVPSAAGASALRPSATGGTPARTGPGRKPKQGSPARPKRQYKSTDDWGVFRAVVIGVGVLIAAVGAYYLVTGTAGVPDSGGGPVNASLESQFRFYSALMVGVGAAFVAIAVKFQWANMLWLVCLLVFLGGIGRVLSWAFSGTPHFTMIVLMILELAFPPALLVWHRFIAKTSDLRRELSRDPAARGESPSAGGTRP